jgi:hypothetical protein
MKNTTDQGAPAGADGEPLGEPVAVPRRRRIRSRLTDGRTLLTGVNSQTAWVRLLKDMNEAMLAHVGGADHATEPQQLTARRVAVLECELRFQERKIAQIRAAGGEPDEKLIDLYSRVSNTQRRHLEMLGVQRVPRDVTPSLQAYLAAKEEDPPV